jgi:hypothetical protein
MCLGRTGWVVTRLGSGDKRLVVRVCFQGVWLQVGAFAVAEVVADFVLGFSRGILWIEGCCIRLR